MLRILKKKLFEVVRENKCYMHELVDENLKKGNRSDQKLNFREVIDSIYE